MAFTAFVLVDSAAETHAEWRSGQPLYEMADDLAMLVLSVVVAGMLVREFWQRQRSERDLREELKTAWGKISEMQGGLQHTVGNQYRDIVQKQFDTWRLSESEQDIVINLLKGLSFKEVAAVRNTHEKTARQQAANVYRKSGLAGRHELAAWFLEDLLDPVLANTD